MTLEVRDLSVRYGSVTAARNVDIDCGPGQLVAIVGPNGAGKSSSLNAIAGAIPAATTTGSVRLDAVPIDGMRAERIVEAGLALVPEGRRIFASLSVAENLALAASTKRGATSTYEDREAVMRMFPVLAERSRQPAGELSGGEQQQLAIGRALLCGPRVLLLDEPSLGLAPMMVEVIFDALLELRDAGLAILLVEQNAVRAVEMADHFYVMAGGRCTRSTHATKEYLAQSYFGVEQQA